MPIGGKLVLKGGVALGAGGVDKKKKKKKSKDGGGGASDAAAAAAEAAATTTTTTKTTAAAPLPQDKLPQSYEKAFDIEARRLQQGRERSTAWGASYRPVAPGAVLHGYSTPVTGATAEERLDLRSAAKADRYCK